MSSSARKAVLIEAAKAGREGRLRIDRPDLGRGLPIVVEAEGGERFEGDEYVSDLNELVKLGVFYEESDDVFRLESFRPSASTRRDDNDTR